MLNIFVHLQVGILDNGVLREGPDCVVAIARLERVTGLKRRRLDILMQIACFVVLYEDARVSMEHTVLLRVPRVAIVAITPDAVQCQVSGVAIMIDQLPLAPSLVLERYSRARIVRVGIGLYKPTCVSRRVQLLTTYELKETENGQLGTFLRLGGAGIPQREASESSDCGDLATTYLSSWKTESCLGSCFSNDRAVWPSCSGGIFGGCRGMEVSPLSISCPPVFWKTVVAI